MSDVGTALVGFGYWGANLARNVHAAEGLRLIAIVDADAERRVGAAAAHPSARVESDVAAVLADPDVSAVLLATPAASHEDLALRVIEAGKHLFVEKPLATTVPGCRSIAEATDRMGVTVMVGHTFLYSAPVAWLRDAIRDGELGAVQYLYSQRLNLGRIRSDCNALWNFGPHDVSILLHLLDERPTEVSANGFAFLQEGIDDVCFATLRFPSGVAANVHVSWIDPRKTRLMTVVGDRKMAVFDDVSSDRKIALYDAGVTGPDASLGEFTSLGDFQWRTRAGDVVLPRIDLREPLLVEMEAFATACRTGEPPLTDVRHGTDVVRVLCAAEGSVAKGGAPVEIGW